MPPNPATASSTEQVFSAARDAFKAGDFQRALDLTDQVIKDESNVPVVHEFRALCLFALKRYDEAAAVDYAVLSAGPGWNWSTLVGLYRTLTPTPTSFAPWRPRSEATRTRLQPSFCSPTITWFKATRKRRQASSRRSRSFSPATSSRPRSSRL